MDVSIPCSGCSENLRPGDAFCEACGARVTPEAQRQLQERLEAADPKAAERAKHLRSASQTILVLAVLFVLGGVLYFFMAQSDAKEALRNIAEYDAAHPLDQPIAGATTIGELRAAIEREPFQLLGLNFMLAAVMTVLYFWSKRSLLAALITALGVYVAVQLASALVDPTTLAQGIIMKVFIVAALIRGVKTALESRALGVAR
jgi:hypothetical protein